MVTRVYFQIDENSNVGPFNFQISKESNEVVLINNLVVKFKTTPIYYYTNKLYKSLISDELESVDEFIKYHLTNKNTLGDSKMVTTFIERVNSLSIVDTITVQKTFLEENLGIKLSDYTTDTVDIICETCNTVGDNNSFIVIPNNNNARQISWGGYNDVLADDYADTLINNKRRVLSNYSLGNGEIQIYDIVDSFILGKSSQHKNDADKFNEMITTHVNKSNKSSFYEHVKRFNTHKFTVSPGSINNIVSGSNKIFDSVLKEDYPFESREYLFISPSEQIINITGEEFTKIKKRDMVIYLGLNDNDQVNFEINNSVIRIKQEEEGVYTLNSDTIVNFTDKTFNVDKYRFEMVFSGSLGIQLAGVHRSGIGGDPYIQPLIGPKFKIPYGVDCYKYLDNADVINPFVINFSTLVLVGDDLKYLNSFVLNTIKQRNKLDNVTDTVKMLLSKGLCLDTKACFMDKIFIKNGEQEMYFDLNKFRVIDSDGNTTGLPYGFKPVHANNININESIGQHIIINNEKPITTLRITTYNATYGTILIDFMKFKHPQIRNAINIHTDEPLTEANCVGAIISETNIRVSELKSLVIVKTKKMSHASRKIIEEVYLDEDCTYSVNDILE